jgi:hypothetical protein
MQDDPHLMMATQRWMNMHLPLALQATAHWVDHRCFQNETWPLNKSMRAIQWELGKRELSLCGYGEANGMERQDHWTVARGQQH